MANVNAPSDRKYTTNGDVWVKEETDGTVQVGVTEYSTSYITSNFNDVSPVFITCQAGEVVRQGDTVGYRCIAMPSI